MAGDEAVDAIVIGAGSAGSVLAGRLSEDGRRRVVLLEAGSGEPPAGRTIGPSFFDAVDEPGRTWPLLEVRRSAEQEPRRYLRGRGLGGSSAVNAMIALPTHPDDHRRWEEMGAADWGWEAVAPWFERTKLVTTPAAWHEIGPVSSGLLRAAPGDSVVVPLTRDENGRRISASDAYLADATERSNLTIRGDSHVDRILIEDGRAVGVRLVDGTEVFGGEIVVAAGSLHSPAILLRSGLTRPGIGRNLKDHASMPIVLYLRPEQVRDPSTLPISVITTWSSGEHADDLQLLAIDHLGAGSPGVGMVMVGLMTAESSGTVRLRSNDPLRDPEIEMNMLSTDSDVRRLRRGTERALDLLRGPDFRRIAEVGDVDLSDSGLLKGLGDYVHAVGTCRIGRPDDPDAVVDSWGRVYGTAGLRVCDASVMPDVPRANTHLITVVIAERIAAQMQASSSSIASRR